MGLKLKIRGKLVFSFTVVIGMVLIAIGIITYFTFAESIRNNKEEIARLQIQAINIQLDRIIEGVIYDLKKISHSMGTVSPDQAVTESQEKLIRDSVLTNTDISDLAVTTSDGKILISTSNNNEEILQKYIQQLNDNGLNIHSNTDGLWLIHRDQSSNHYAARLKIDEIMPKLLSNTSLSQAEFNIHKDNTLIYTTGDVNISRKLSSTSGHDELNKNSQSSMDLIDDHYVITVPQPQYGWYISVYLAESVIVEDLVKLKNRLITTVIIVLWVSIWIVLIVAHRISQPLRNLSEATHDIQKFNYSTPLRFPLTHDEISDLANSFESMRVYIKGQISRDPLTGLNNRRFLMHAMGLEMAKAQRAKQSISVVMVDLDHFKSVNDTHGHQGGDHILMETAKVLQDGVRKYDIAARYGGEEFALVLPYTNSDGALIVAERIRAALEDTKIDWDGKEIYVTMSVGISSFQFSEQTDPDDIEQITYNLFENADEALYQAKEAGRNQCRIYQQPTP